MGSWSARWGLGSLIPVSVADNAVERLDAVLPGDLLAFLVVAAAVADRHLVDPALPRRPAFEGRHGESRHLGRHLGLEPEPVALKGDPLEHFPAEDFVAD